ncbi:MAG: TonB-dependent receptor [Bacteroidia bacterium]|nr:TonB-dependent receptor [Bacteroidia bacterium]
MQIRKLAYVLAGIFLWVSSGNAQSLTQTVRGKVVDSESQYPLPGVSVILIQGEGSSGIGTYTDENGEFRLASVPVGRQAFVLSFIGYERVLLNNIEVTSAKEVILNIAMEASGVQLDVVEIAARRNGEVGNELAFVSAREFSVVETNLYAGSRGEPARMASNYAGVQGADDSRNDIVIRGNSPQGVLWRLDGINIPNPNHFSIPGTGGGPVTVLNNKFLTNSDFFTGAFPSEYGNGIAGVFDLKMRNGNNEKHEFSGQLGFLGTELMAEGPLSKKTGASYLATYRYSTLGLFSFLGINVGTDAIPQYQDGSFRINLPQKNGGTLAIWGIGGLSDIDIVLSDQVAPDSATLIFGSNDRDQYFGSNMGIIAASYTHPININTYIKTSVAFSKSLADTHHDQIFRHVEVGEFVVDSLPPILDYKYDETKYSAYFHFNKKIKLGQTLKLGINADWYQMNYLDSVRIVNPGTNPTLDPWRMRWNSNQGAALLQPFIQYKAKVGEKLSLTAGITSMYWSLNQNSFSPIEPRLGLSYEISEGKRLSFGTGLHSQIQSPYLYFFGYETNGRDPLEHNLDMGLTKSAHIVLGYDWTFAKDMRLKAETYYQYLYEIPVEMRASSFSLVNSGAGFSRFFPDTLVNEGTGRNFGLELTIEKFFSRGYYFLLTGSVFDAKYTGSDNVLRNTSFNGKFAFNGLVAKEFTINETSALQIGAKLTSVGGRWYGPVNETESARQLEIVYEDASVNTLQFRPYFRADGKITYRWNRPKVTHEFSVDLVNVFNIKNILTLTYAPDHPSGNPIREEYQLGFLPIFFYKIDW